jgi:hypothetical protein
MINNNAHKTAITRKVLSVPMRYLSQQGKIQGPALDYGCGKGFDADQLYMDGYDPHFRPEMPGYCYNTITCNYVLNVVQDDEAVDILAHIQSLLAPGGVAYITIRRDIKKEGWTSKGTYQVNRALNLPVETEKKGAFIMYRMEA